MWAIGDALPLEAVRDPSPSACQVLAQSSDARLSYCDFTDFRPRGGLNSTTDLGDGLWELYQIFHGHRPIIDPTRY